MHIALNTTPSETLEYLRTVNSVLRNNQQVDDSIKAYRSLKDLVLAIDKRLTAIDKRLTAIEESRRNNVCR